MSPDESSGPTTGVLLKVGALARRTGLTVRTLHHYEEIGLLPPAGRNRAGHRIYGMAQVRRLHQITSLKQMGLSLDEIREALDGDQRSLDEILDLQIRRLQQRIEAEQALCDELEELRARLRSGEGTVGLEELADAVGRSVRVEEYYSAEQMDALRARAEDLGEARIHRAQEEWQELFQAYHSAMERGKPPDHPDVVALARRARELLALFTGGDARIRASLDRMYRSEDPERMMTRHGVSVAPGLWEYMQRAAEALAREG